MHSCIVETAYARKRRTTGTALRRCARPSARPTGVSGSSEADWDLQVKEGDLRGRRSPNRAMPPNAGLLVSHPDVEWIGARFPGEGLSPQRRRYSVFLSGVAQSDTARRFTYLRAACTTDLSKPQFVDLIEVINQIPIHELGHKDLVQAVFMTK